MQHAAVMEQQTMAPPKPLVSKQAASAVNAYRKEQVLNMSPVEVIKRLYEVAITACRKQDADLSRRAINELIAGLNFEYEEIAIGLYKLYDYSKRCIRQGNFDEAAGILDELRATWVQAFKLE
ncbi:MAG: flagellar protein FliS [Bacteroidetes bacterium]|nr:flagellar protein FliS [Bacteroidota bacterium]